MLHPFHLLLLPALFYSKRVVGAELIIKSANNFSSFVNDVNNKGSSYSGTTVYLGTDLSLSGKTLEPIGKGNNNQFLGVFDGQGYVISDLKINSTSEYTGLFGYSKGLTIRNVVLDSSCTITNSYSGSSFVYVGGIIGYCEANSGQCAIENSVNIAGITFCGTINSETLHIGGFAGLLQSSAGIDAIVDNCANYGPITHSGTSGSSNIGGIIGFIDVGYDNYTYIRNCLNYGLITHNGTTSNVLNIGGIEGYSWYTYIENCVSSGRIVTQTSTSAMTKIGGIAGTVSTKTYINYCYYTSNVKINNIYGYSIDQPEINNTPNSTTAANSTLITHLNNYTSNGDWNKWVFNNNGAHITFVINTGKGFTINSQIIILPNPINNVERTFGGWYTDETLTIPFTGDEIDSDTTLYGLFCGSSSYTVTLDTNGGDALDDGKDKMLVKCNGIYGTFPENVTRTGASFLGWFTEKEGGNKVESGDKVTNFNDHTLYAQWGVKNYAITFILNNGEYDVVKTFKPSSPVTYPEDPTRTGYTFNGWSENVATMPAHNLNVTALWTINNYTITFIYNNEESDVVKTFNYSQNVIYPENATRTGYRFNGWSEYVTTMPAHNLNITALWTINNYTITFIFDNGDNDALKTFNYNQTVIYPENATRTGYSFNGWNKSDTKYMPNHNLIITALWTPNNYTVTFDTNGGDALDEPTKLVTFDSTYGDLPIPTREGEQTFSMWLTEENNRVMNTTIVKIPNNHKLHALWTEMSRKHVPAIGVGVSIPIVVIILATILLILFMKKKNAAANKRRFEYGNPLIDKGDFADHYHRTVSRSEDFSGNVTSKDVTSTLSHLYPMNYARPTMRNALLQAGLTQEQTDCICSACANTAHIIASEGKLFKGFTEDDAAAIAMYTYDFGSSDFESNPYRIVNKSLAERNYNNLQKASGLLYLVMTALRKLPRYTGKMLYRGVRGEVNLDKDHYRKGNIITWSALSSTSPSMDTTNEFLAKGSKSGQATGTLFIIEEGWGYDIQPYSLFPDEAEVLLELGRQFEVTSVIKADLTVITLKMLDIPVPLPHIFGKANAK